MQFKKFKKWAFQLWSAPRPRFLLFRNSHQILCKNFPNIKFEENMASMQIIWKTTGKKYWKILRTVMKKPGLPLTMIMTVMRKSVLLLTMMMATGLKHELGFCLVHDRTWGPRQELATIRDKWSDRIAASKSQKTSYFLAKGSHQKKNSGFFLLSVKRGGGGLGQSKKSLSENTF